MPTNHDLATWFFLQLAAILTIAHLTGWLVTRFGQPRVVGEMIAGVLLGPSLFGWLAPEVASQLFPAKIEIAGQVVQHPLKLVIYTLAQIGVALYMFCVGADVDLGVLRARRGAAGAISLAGIIVPFALGSVLAWGLSGGGAALFAAEAALWQKCLFMGSAMSITAFPMLARIIFERGLTGGPLGALTLASGAIDDAAAWCLLAVVLAGFNAKPEAALLTIGGGAAFALVTFLLVRPLLRRFAEGGAAGPRPVGVMLPLSLILLAVAAYATDAIGIYAVFGAFILGASMPRTPVIREVIKRIEPITTTLLVPFFFIYSGLNTRLTMVDSWALWGLAALVLLGACIGKLGACYAAARLCGEPRREAWAIGSLMNARGLMELILLNIGLEHGLITPRLFSIMVLMAIVTTLMATPLFEWGYGRHARRAGTLPA